MNAAYAFVFLVLAGVAAVAAAVGWGVFGWPAFAFGYAAVAFVFLATAYAGVGPRLLGKRANGRRSARGWLLFAPYFMLNAVTFRLYRILTRGPALAPAAPNLFFGRRLTAREAQDAEYLGWLAVLDLAAEFPEVPPLRKLPGYRSLPVLDAAAPTESQLRDAVGWLTTAVTAGPVYVHCALGHGRTVCVVVAYLLSIGAVGTAVEGVRLLRSLRPGVRLNRSQRRALRGFEPAAIDAA